MPDVQLLDKTEVWVRDIHLDGVDLPALARAAAAALNLDGEKVFVTDVRDGCVVFDVLAARVALEDVTGKMDVLLAALARVPGVTIGAAATVHSEGILGVIGVPRADASAYLDASAKLERQIAAYTASRVAIVSTGFEVVAGMVEDTNFTAARNALGAAGYEVVFGGVAGDSDREIAGLVARLASEGFGFVITTGGVGAEDKDRTIEALQLLDPDLATAILAQYTVGHGRHVKAAVRVGVGRLGWTRLIALPGPTHEVAAALAVIVREAPHDPNPQALAEAIAAPLRALLPRHHGGHHGGHH